MERIQEATVSQATIQGDQERKEACNNQAAGPETSRLHCWTAAALHVEYKLTGIRQGNKITDLMAEALQNYTGVRQ